MQKAGRTAKAIEEPKLFAAARARFVELTCHTRSTKPLLVTILRDERRIASDTHSTTL